ncbi:MAG TPA: PHP domain-containing protein [Desulfobacterales bacterium]|nr:PHP domain-containing protein [Desulfobacterales bacterium]
MYNTNRIQFEKPNLAELTSRYTVVDLHFHTQYSDGKNTIKEIADRAAELGIGISITDHNEIAGAVEIDNYKNILSIPGIEVTSEEGTHILIYFYETDSLKRFYASDVKPFMGHDIMSSTSLIMEEIISRARAYNSVIIFPHPFCAAYTGICNLHFPKERLNRLLDRIDGIEVINSGNLNKWNLKSSVLGFNLDKAVTGGSDGHTVQHMGRSVTWAACMKNRKAFLDAIKQKRNKVIGKEIDILKKVATNGFKLRTNIKNYPDLVEKNIKYSCILINSKSKILRDNLKRRLNEKIRKKEKNGKNLSP